MSDKKTDRPKRQIFAMLDNRCVVFAPENALPRPSEFSAKADSPPLPRVASDFDGFEARIVETLRLSGFEKASPDNTESSADVVFHNDAGERFLVELKVKDSDPKGRDFERSKKQIEDARAKGEELEVWYINRERLRLTVIYGDDDRPHLEELFPLDVWEKTVDGVFSRANVEVAVEEWVKKLMLLYSDIEAWLRDRPALGIRCEQIRSVTMSEELMQRFGVSDRELPILDLLSSSRAVASFVPRGLWLIGAHGRVDIITEKETKSLLGEDDPRGWLLISSRDRRSAQPFGENQFFSLVEAS